MNAVFTLKIIIVMSGNAERVTTAVGLGAKDHGKDIMEPLLWRDWALF